MNLNERSARFVTRAGDRVTIDTSKAYGEPLLANRRKAVPKAKAKAKGKFTPPLPPLTEEQLLRLSRRSLAQLVAPEVGPMKSRSETVVSAVLERIKGVLIRGGEV